MLYLKIKDNTQQAKAFAEYIKTLPFVEIIEAEDFEKITKTQLLDDIKTSLKEVKEKQTKPFKDLLDGE
ncbi:MAG: hypothetical protein ACOVQA_04635 [Thermoflexibacteraceae bacterium]|jgi:hypothetical protein